MNQVNFTRGQGFLENFLVKQRAQKADSFISSSQRKGRILDIGCGLIPYFLLHTDFQEKFGIDSATTTLPQASGIKIHCEAIHKNKALPYQESFLDVVTLLGVLEHFEPEEVSSLFKQIHRILKPQGRFILTTPHPYSGQLLKVLGRFRLISPQEIKDIRASYSVKMMSSFLEEAGFAPSKMHFGCFQGGLNTWVWAEK